MKRDQIEELQLFTTRVEEAKDELCRLQSDLIELHEEMHDFVEQHETEQDIRATATPNIEISRRRKWNDWEIWHITFQDGSDLWVAEKFGNARISGNLKNAEWLQYLEQVPGKPSDITDFDLMIGLGKLALE